ncbi:MAG: PQQ-like beta-propeller repeat protein [Candidatus Coatesbacteria bacterium]|nr:PQQ-like beta-propeller repeat protein [Candidatus Coatesbacteria bacterium]
MVVSRHVLSMIILVFLLASYALCMENWPPFWVGPDGDYTRTRAADIVLPRCPVVSDMLLIPREGASRFFIYPPSVYADGTAIVAVSDGGYPPMNVYCVSPELELNWEIEFGMRGRPELFPGPDNTMFLNHTGFRAGYYDPLLACYSLEDGEQLWSTTTTIMDLYYDLSALLGPEYPYWHLIDRKADIGPDGILYGWTEPSTIDPRRTGVLFAVSTTGTIGVLNSLENPLGSMVLNKISMITAQGEIAFATWSDPENVGSCDTDIYKYRYDAATNQFTNIYWSTISDFRPLVRPLFFGENLVIIDREWWENFVFHFWPRGGDIFEFEPETEMRPYGRLFCNTGRIHYSPYSLKRDTSSTSPQGFYLDFHSRAYIDGVFAWDDGEGLDREFYMYNVLLVDREDSIVCADGHTGYSSGLMGYEMVESGFLLSVVSSEGAKSWGIDADIYEGWGSNSATPFNLAPAPNNTLLMFLSPESSWCPDHLKDRMCCVRVVESDDSTHPAAISAFASVLEDQLVLFVGFFCKRPLHVDAYTAMRTPSGELIYLPAMSQEKSPLFPDVYLPPNVLYTPRAVNNLELGTDVTESGEYTFYALLTDPETGEVMSNLAQATVSVVVP